MKTFGELIDDGDFKILEDENENLSAQYNENFISWFEIATGIEDPKPEDVGRWINETIRMALDSYLDKKTTEKG